MSTSPTTDISAPGAPAKTSDPTPVNQSAGARSRLVTSALAALVLACAAARAWLSLRTYDATPGHRAADHLSANLLPTPLDPDNWTAYMFGGAEGKVNVQGENVVVTIYRSDKIDWHYQCGVTTTHLVPGHTYVATFRARADFPHDIMIGTPSDSPIVPVGTQWRDYRAPFHIKNGTTGAVMVPQFNAGSREGRLWLTDIRVTAIPDR